MRCYESIAICILRTNNNSRRNARNSGFFILNNNKLIGVPFIDQCGLSKKCVTYTMFSRKNY